MGGVLYENVLVQHALALGFQGRGNIESTLAWGNDLRRKHVSRVMSPQTTITLEEESCGYVFAVLVISPSSCFARNMALAARHVAAPKTITARNLERQLHHKVHGKIPVLWAGY